ncbi:MAG: DHH family phosphoesterase [Clostridia bacterium]|nr:DHH family phosphoesterase [Clostridia bacterium]
MPKNTTTTPIAGYFNWSFLLAALAGVLFMLLTGLALAGLPGVIFALLLSVVYVCIIVVVRVLYVRKRHRKAGNETLAPVMGRIMFDAVVKMKTPVFICDSEERIIWYNTATESLFVSEGRFSVENKLYGRTVSDLFGVNLAQIRDDKTEDGVSLTCEGRSFTAKYNHIKTDDNDFALVVTTETTQAGQLRRKLDDSELVVMYIYIDNLTEMMQYDSENYRSAASRTDQVLRDWAEECGGILKEYERDKYLFVTEHRVLEACVSRKFDLLDRIRAIRVGDGNLPMTISMGVSGVHGSFADKERTAHTALDMALQRGGDQAVIKNDDSIDFYGGITKTVQKRTNVRSRMVSGELTAAMKKASNVLIMGHKYADYDSFGACVGLARMAMYCGARVNVIVNPADRGILGCREMLDGEEDFLGVFVDGAMGLDLLETGTLVLVADVNNVRQMESTDIFTRAETVAIIDHHRKTAEFERNLLIEYIEPSASSASELVSEMLEQVLPKDELTSHEASLLLTGIILDTLQFTRSTGTRTFSAAMFLRDCDASPDTMQHLNKTSLDDYMREGRFRQNVMIYRGRTAIACPQIDSAEAGPADQIIAAKAANNLLTVAGVEASFALIRIGEKIHISARSNGKVNVQVILEELHGGGHYDAAGAQLDGCTMKDAVEQLKAAIDKKMK